MEGHGICRVLAVGDKTEQGKVFEAVQIEAVPVSYTHLDVAFWNIFIPVKKNLIVGVPLLYSLTEDELRAILR